MSSINLIKILCLASNNLFISHLLKINDVLQNVQFSEIPSIIPKLFFHVIEQITTMSFFNISLLLYATAYYNFIANTLIPVVFYGIAKYGAIILITFIAAYVGAMVYLKRQHKDVPANDASVLALLNIFILYSDIVITGVLLAISILCCNFILLQFSYLISSAASLSYIAVFAAQIYFIDVLQIKSLSADFFVENTAGIIGATDAAATIIADALSEEVIEARPVLNL
jgi:hypothetical protein